MANPEQSEEGRKVSRPALLAVGGTLGALAASSCCILPLVLVSLGLGGAWMGNVTALAPYQPYFMVATAVMLAVGFRLAYRKPSVVCEPDAACTKPVSGHIVKAALWGATLLLLSVFLLPYLAPLFLEN